MLYKEGDILQVREDLSTGVDYNMLNSEGGSDGASYRMVRDYRGKTVTITSCRIYGYKIKEDNGEWNWTDEMFELSNKVAMRFLEKKRENTHPIPQFEANNRPYIQRNDRGDSYTISREQLQEMLTDTWIW